MSPFIINFVYCHVRIVCKKIAIVTRCLRKIKKKEYLCSIIILINMILVFSLLIMRGTAITREDEESEEQYKKIIFMSR